MKKLTKGLYVLSAGLLAFGLASCGSKEEVVDDYKMSLYTPGGAPGISAVYMNSTLSDKYDITLGMTGVQVKSALEANQVDAVVAPFNVGLAAFNGSGYYQCAAVVTWGNLYLASQTPFTISDCKAENTILFGKASIPGKVTSYVLASNNSTNANDFTYLSDSTDTVAQIKLAENESKIYLIAEPALTATKAAVKNTLGKDLTIVSVQDEYKKITGQDTFPQAALFIRKETIANHKTVVNNFITDIKLSCEKTSTDTENVANLAKEAELFANPTVLKNAMPKCAINYVEAANCKDNINAFVNPVLGGANPADGFYY